jgi:hypothetical protein
MIRKLTQFVSDHSNVKVLIVFAILFAITQVLMISKPWGLQALESISPGVKILDVQFNYSPQEAHKTLLDLGESGRNAYLKLITADFFYIAAYTCFLIISLTLIFNFFFPEIKAFKLIWLLPFVSGMSDFFENIGTIIQLVEFPNQLFIIPTIENIFTMLKMITYLPCEILVPIGLIGYLFTVVKNKLKANSLT